MPIGSGTRLLALLGDPVRHSLSPTFQNAAIRAAGVDAVYVALRCDPDLTAALVRALARAGGGGNVTVPHKARAAAAVDVRTPAVERTGACNTFWLEDGRVHGDNTDVEGFAAAARRLLGSPAGARVLVLGAGGAARAVVLALLDGRADAVHLLNRTPGRARALVQALDPRGRRVVVVEDSGRLAREGYDVVVNATSLGLHPDDPLPFDLDRLARVGAVLDLTYRAGPPVPGGGRADGSEAPRTTGPAARGGRGAGASPGAPDGREAASTPWVRAALERDLPALDGREMLLHQGAASFRRWFSGQDPDLAVMRAALAGAGAGTGAGAGA